MSPTSRYWFRSTGAARGSGLPASGAGWAFIGVWLALVAGSAAAFLPDHPSWLILSSAVLYAVLVLVRKAKGEPV